MTVVEINDVGLAVRQREVLLASSPAFVHLGRKETRIGPEAQSLLKLDPTRTESQFWDRFGRDELRRRHKAVRYQADLAYLHLENLWKRAGSPSEPTTIAVPGDFRNDQIALLLGVAQRVGIPVANVVDQAVAALARPRPGRRLMHLDVHLHRVVLSALSQGEDLVHERSWSSAEVGLLRVFDAWADSVARIFVQSTRFDPMHDAAVEQLLYDQLAGWAAALTEQDSVAISLEDRGRRFDTELGRAAIVAAAGPVYQRLRVLVADAMEPDAPTTLSVTHRAGCLPGLTEALLEIPELEVVVLSETAVGVGVEELPAPDSEDGGVPFIRRKPWLARSEHSAHAQAVGDYSRRRPTHWLADGVAKPLGPVLALAADGQPADNPSGAALLIHAAADDAVQVEAAAELGLGINGRVASGGMRKVHAGDRLRLDVSGLDITLITVEHDGP